MSRWNRFWGFMRRHKVQLAESLLLVAAVVVVTFLSFEFEIFRKEGAAPEAQQRIELSEVMLIAAVLCVGLLLFAARRLQEQRRELRWRIAAEQEVRQLAFNDPLTGLPNRRSFRDALVAAIAAPPRTGGAHAVLMIDLNGFKRINDLFGHGTGDEVLIAVSASLFAQGAVRNDDLVARLGGDEFAVLARHIAGPEEATSVAQRLARSLDEPVAGGASQHKVSAGIGIALTPQDGGDLTELLRKADIALYRAKETPGSAMRFFEPEMDAKLREREVLDRELATAVKKELIELAYQPILDLKSKTVIGFEALPRWSNAVLGGTVAANRFIPVAAEMGLIKTLTLQLLRRACETAMTWPDQVVLAFNISPTELQDETLGMSVLQILGQTGLPARRLEIEITESAVVRDLTAAQRTLGALRAAGVRLALVDFGTGYSSLYHLRSFRVDKIKIDRSFVDGMRGAPESDELARAIIGLGKGLGLDITAEGIETQGQLDFLRNGGCEQGQGFLFSRAVSGDDTLTLVGEKSRQPAVALAG